MWPEEPEGILLVDKPPGPTSHDVVQRVKSALGAKKAGHLGTLDPAATGILVVCVNDATKIAPFLAGHDKEYRGTLLLGVETDTQDAQGKVMGTIDPGHIAPEQIRTAFAGFIGPVLQRPPAYSAVKRGGVPMYKLARAGKKAQAPVRAVTVKELEIEAINMPRVTFRALVTAGTYIRTLAHDIGKKLGVGAHLESLRRLRSGPYRVENAIPLEELSIGPGQRKAYGALIPLSRALEGWPEITLQGGAARRVAHGNGLTRGDFDRGDACISGSSGETARAIDSAGRLIAVMKQIRSAGKQADTAETDVLWHPIRVWER